MRSFQFEFGGLIFGYFFFFLQSGIIILGL